MSCTTGRSCGRWAISPMRSGGWSTSASSTAAVNGVGIGIGAVSQRLRHVQTGLVTNYALAIALGMVVLVGIYLGLSSTLFR